MDQHVCGFNMMFLYLIRIRLTFTVQIHATNEQKQSLINMNLVNNYTII